MEIKIVLLLSKVGVGNFPHKIHQNTQYMDINKHAKHHMSKQNTISSKKKQNTMIYTVFGRLELEAGAGVV